MYWHFLRICLTKVSELTVAIIVAPFHPTQASVGLWKNRLNGGCFFQAASLHDPEVS